MGVRPGSATRRRRTTGSAVTASPTEAAWTQTSRPDFRLARLHACHCSVAARRPARLAAAFAGGLWVTGAWLVWRDTKRHPGAIRPTVLCGMLLESLFYAVIFGFVVSALAGLLLRATLAIASGKIGALPLAAQLVVSLGAG